VGSDRISDIRIKHQSVDAAHLIISKSSTQHIEFEQDEGVVLVYDNASDRGTSRKTAVGKESLKPQTTYEFGVGEQLQFFVGGKIGTV